MSSENSNGSLVAPDVMQRLRERLLLPLPGKEYQFRMAHFSRIAQIPMRHDVRIAAVLLLLFEKDAQWNVVLIKRKAIPADVHGGQISFPGGRVHRHESIEEAALRESFEEIGSPHTLISTLGRLTQLHIPISNHLVFPVVAHLNEHVPWQQQDSEVDFILEVPIHILELPQTRVIAPIRLKDGLTLPEVPCFNVNGHLIWGATAMILSEFMEVVKK